MTQIQRMYAQRSQTSAHGVHVHKKAKSKRTHIVRDKHRHTHKLTHTHTHTPHIYIHIHIHTYVYTYHHNIPSQHTYTHTYIHTSQHIPSQHTYTPSQHTHTERERVAQKGFYGKHHKQRGMGTKLKLDVVVQSLEVNDDSKHKHSGKQVGHVGQVLAVEGLTQGLDLVGTGQQQGEHGDDGSLELGT